MSLHALRAPYLIATLTALLSACSLPSADQGSKSDTVELSDPGAEPRAPLRYSLAEGATQTLSIAIAVGGGMRMDGRDVPHDRLPEIQATLEITVKEVRPTGDFECTFAVESTSVEGGGPAEQAMAGATARIRKLEGRFVLTPRGELEVFEVELPPSADNQARQLMAALEEAMRQTFVPLPDEPVGEGATWSSNTERSHNGITLEQATTYKLSVLEAHALELAVTIDQRAKAQKVSPPGVPVEVPISLHSLSGTGKGTLLIDRRAPLPSRGRVGLHTETSMSIEQAGKTDQIETQTEATYSFRTR